MTEMTDELNYQISLLLFSQFLHSRVHYVFLKKNLITKAAMFSKRALCIICWIFATLAIDYPTKLKRLKLFCRV